MVINEKFSRIDLFVFVVWSLPCCDNIVSANQIREAVLHCLVSTSFTITLHRSAQSNVRIQLVLNY